MSEPRNEHIPDEAELLLPFLVNGTLTDKEKHMVEAALAADPTLAAEARDTALLREGMRDMPSPASPGEFGLARLMRDIGREGPTASGTRKHRGLSRFAMAIAASVALLAVGLIGLNAVQQGDDDSYQQASGNSGAGELSVAFDAAASQAAVTDLLLDHDLVVVDGPSALGIYRLAVPQGADPVGVADALRQATGLVENVGVSE